jgi:hypothetical protein
VVEGEHRGVAAAQALPHPPQLAGSETLTSHPSSARLEQCVHPLAQDDTENEQTPDEHVTAPVRWGSAVQSCPQVPQFALSVCKSTHPLLHES